jgi:hypothetical protein
MGWRAGAGAGFAGLRRAGRHTGGSTVLPILGLVWLVEALEGEPPLYWGQYGSQLCPRAPSKPRQHGVCSNR